MFFKKTTWRDYLTLKEINPIIRYLTISDIAVVSGFGLVAPIFAVFITENISGNIAVVGISEAIYLISKSLLQIPFANLMDKIKGEKDDFLFLFTGTLLMSFAPLLYLVIVTPMQLYIVQLLYGASAAIAIPSWYAIFTRHIDKKHEGIEWGVYRTFVDLGSGLAAIIGGFLAYEFGFNSLFILVSIISFFGSFILLLIRKNLKK